MIVITTNDKIKINEDGFFYFQMVFRFKKKLDFDKFFDDFRTTSYFLNILTTTTTLDKNYLLHFKIKSISELKIPETFNDIKKKYSKLLQEIHVSNFYSYEFMDDSMKDKIRTTNKSEIDFIITFFTRRIESSMLEVVLQEAVLNNLDATLSDDKLDSFFPKGEQEEFKNLFKLYRFSTKDVRKFLQVIETNDLILIKTIITLMVKRGYSFKDIIEHDFKGVKGKKPYNNQEFDLDLLDLKDFREFSHNLPNARLEIFFKSYIHINNLVDFVNEKEKLKEKAIKIEIPISPVPYGFPSNKENQEINEFFIDMLDNNGTLFLTCFERVLRHELKRLLNFKSEQLRRLLVCFSIDDNQENINILKKKHVFFDDLTRMQLEKLEQSNFKDKLPKEDGKTLKTYQYVVIKGFIQRSNESQLKRGFFKIRDEKEIGVNCKISRNEKWFNSLKLDMETKVLLQAHLVFTFKTDERDGYKILGKYLQVINLEIKDQFEPIEIVLSTHFKGRKELQNNREGLSIYSYTTKGEVYKTKILDEPIHLKAIYKGQNDLFYEVKINSQTVTKTKIDLLNYIDNETTLVINSSQLKDCLTNVLRGYEKMKEMEYKTMFRTVGIFYLEDKRDLFLVHPENEDITVIGENDIQFDYIQKLKEKEIDKDGSLTQNFHEILHLDTIPTEVRIALYGYSAIHPFFFGLSKALDVFPNLFLIGIGGSGKTTFLELMINFMYGSQMKSPDAIDSPARLTKYSTESTIALNIDDIDVLELKLMNYIKTNSTRKGTRDRLTKEQRKVSEQTYTSYTGSANKKDWLLGSKNDAFRKRCMIFTLNKKIPFSEETSTFEKNHDIIREGKVFGFYLMNEALNFINDFSNQEITTYQKLISLLNKTKRELKTHFLKKSIPLCDIRRLTIYALIRIGLQFWNHVFKKKKLRSKIIEDALNYREELFFNMVRDLEFSERRIGLEKEILY